VAEKMSGFRLRILATAHHPKAPAAEPGIEIVGLKQLLRESDLVSIHL